ncbi:hypothetical protein CAL7716_059200 [Calothrix sp. PCC 7716]|nr:hypothetical protein CAL7716_059200 [Calothrix sp. PCC 7716]
MADILTSISAVVLTEASKTITGKLLTEDQINAISKNIVGRYFTDFLPTSQKELEAEERISTAKLHISEATKIIVGLQDDLEQQAQKLDLLAKEIEEKKQIAERYAAIAQTDKSTVDAYKAEIEQAIQKTLTAKSEEGKVTRRVLNLVGWSTTLILGAFLGAAVQIYLEPVIKPAHTQPSDIQPVLKISP